MKTKCLVRPIQHLEDVAAYQKVSGGKKVFYLRVLYLLSHLCFLTSSAFTPELVFTEIILQILYRIYKIASHSRVFVLNLHTKTVLQNIFFFLRVIRNLTI
jgi:exosortase/archaeosortase